MIKIAVTFENKDKDAENTTVSAQFSNWDSILPWLEKVKTLNEEKDLTQPIGFTSIGKIVDKSNATITHNKELG